jgi:iron complex outermembrane recepter protein
MKASNWKIALMGASVAALTVAGQSTAWAAGSSAQDASGPGGKTAQADGPVSTAPKAVTELQTVVVTAEKRSTNLQKTAVAVRPIRGDELVRAGVDDVSSINKVAPDVSITRVNQGAVVDIRGVESQANNPTSESAVAVLMDGADLAKPQALQGFLYDLANVEIAKGPQGTLYGKDSNGGTVNIITNPASLSGYSAQGQLETGNYDLVRTEGDVNMPVNDTLAVRAAFQTVNHDGYMKSGLDDEDEQSGRLSLLWKPNDRYSAKLVADFSRDTSAQDLAVFNITSAEPGAKVYVPSNPRDDTFYDTVPGGGPSPFHRDSTMGGVTGQFDYNFDAATWTTIAAYRTFNGNTVSPANPGQGPVEVAPNGQSYASGEKSLNTLYYTSYTLETRLASSGAGPWQWVVGGYLSSDVDSGTQIGYANLTTNTPSLTTANPNELARSAALFGQTTYTPAGFSRLHVTLGGRLSVDDKQERGIYTQIGSITPYASYVPEAEHTFRAFTYKANVSYDLTNNSMIYGGVSTGYKAGGYGYGPGLNPSVGPLFQPEQITAYEIGSKNRFFGNRLQLNLEAWYYTYKDFQTNIVMYSCAPRCASFPVITDGSAGAATYKGATASLEYRLTSNDMFKTQYTAISGAYNNYVVQAPTGFSLVATGTKKPVLTESFSGDAIPNVPQWEGQANYIHTFRNVLDGTIDFEGDTQFRGPDILAETYDSVYGLVTSRSAPWIMGDLSLRYAPDRGPWSMTVYVHNISNDLVPIAARYSSQIHATYEAFAPPQTFGVILSAKFQ